MRVIVFALCLALALTVKANGDSCDDLLHDECSSTAEKNGPSEVQPISQKKGTKDSGKAEDEQSDNTTKENYIQLPVGTFERLIEAVKSEKQQSQKSKSNRDVECDDPSLSYTEFLGCKDLKAQNEMAEGTSEISGFTGESVGLSFVALGLLFASLLAAISAARHSKRSAKATEEGNRISLQPYINEAGFKLRFDASVEERPNLTVRLRVKNEGNSIATDFTDLEITECDIAFTETVDGISHLQPLVLRRVLNTHPNFIRAVLNPRAEINYRKVCRLQPGMIKITDDAVINPDPDPDQDLDPVFHRMIEWDEFKEMIMFCNIQGTFIFSDRFTRNRRCQFNIQQLSNDDSGVTSDIHDPISASIIEVSKEQEKWYPTISFNAGTTLKKLFK